MKKQKALIRYRVDWVSVSLVLGVFALSLLPVFVPLNSLNLLLITGLLLFFKPITSLIQHNHVHYAIFNARWLNIAFDLLLAVTAGHLCSEWTLHHNIGHHGNVINSKADPSSVQRPDQSRNMSKLEYVLTGSLKIYPDCCKMAWRFYQQGKARYLKTFVIESLFSVAFYLYVLSVNFKMGLLFFVLANLINRALVWFGAYWQHLDVSAQTIYDSSNMYAGPIFNFFSFNLGYHIAHHEQPTLHWSKLKARTELILAKIPAHHILQKLP